MGWRWGWDGEEGLREEEQAVKEKPTKKVLTKEELDKELDAIVGE